MADNIKLNKPAESVSLKVDKPKQTGGPTEAEPIRPTCKPDGSCCDFVCGN